MQEEVVISSSIVLALANGISNLLLLLATWHSKRLRSPCNLLIGLDSLLYATFFGLYRYIVPRVIGAFWGTISFPNCFLLHAFPIFVFETASRMPVVIAFERLLAVVFPIWIQQRNSFKFAALMAAPAFLLGAGNVAYYGTQIFTKFSEKQVTDCVSDIYRSEIARHSIYKGYATVFICCMMYTAIWMRLRSLSKHSSTSAKSVNGKLFRTLSVFVALISLSWLVPAISELVSLYALGEESEQRALLMIQINSLSIGIGTGAIPPALYAFSSQYREAFNDLFARICDNKAKDEQQELQHSDL